MKYFISLILTLLLSFFIMPIFRLDHYGLYALLIVFGLLNFSLDALLKNKPNIVGLIAILLGILPITVIAFFTTAPMFHSKAYRTILGNVVESDFSKDINPIDLEQIRLVDYPIASILGDKRLGEEPGLGSQAKLGVFRIQMVNNELFWVAPLVHTSFWKWLDNSEGTPGYVMVSATNPQDVRLVRSLKNKKIKIKFQPNAYLFSDLERHIYFNGYFNIGFTDYTFEIDDQGNPFWVVTLFRKEVGFAGSNSIGILVINAQNGKINVFPINKAPSWIDRIQPTDFIEEQITDWGLYVDGWLNSVTSENQVLKMTPGISLVYGKDKKAYWYTGISSSGADESTVGFLLTNTRTKEVKWYKQSGATEIAAMRSAEGKVQEKGYQASFPIMYNILGIPTYFLSLKDKAGLPKLFAFVSVKDFGILGIGENARNAYRSYRSVLKSQGKKLIPSSDSESKIFTGQILRIANDIRNGESYYYMIIKGLNNKTFIAKSTLSVEIPLSRSSDTVTIQYDDSEDRVVDISEFKNSSLSN